MLRYSDFMEEIKHNMWSMGPKPILSHGIESNLIQIAELDSLFFVVKIGPRKYLAVCYAGRFFAFKLVFAP